MKMNITVEVLVIVFILIAVRKIGHASGIFKMLKNEAGRWAFLNLPESEFSWAFLIC
jgi:hypothetical protein